MHCVAETAYYIHKVLYCRHCYQSNCGSVSWWCVSDRNSSVNLSNAPVNSNDFGLNTDPITRKRMNGHFFGYLNEVSLIWIYYILLHWRHNGIILRGQLNISHSVMMTSWRGSGVTHRTPLHPPPTKNQSYGYVVNSCPWASRRTRGRVSGDFRRTHVTSL